MATLRKRSFTEARKFARCRDSVGMETLRSRHDFWSQDTAPLTQPPEPGTIKVMG